MSEWDRVGGKDQEIKLDANPDYWNAAAGYPKTKHIIFKFYSDETSLRLAIGAGDVDMAYRSITANDILDLQTNPNVKVWQGGGAFVQYLCFQTIRPPFDDPRVRTAVVAALNRTAVTETVFLGLAQPLYSIIPPGMLGHSEAFKSLGDANYTLTASLLAQLGYSQSSPLQFDLWYPTGHYQQADAQALVYKQALEGKRRNQGQSEDCRLVKLQEQQGQQDNGRFHLRLVPGLHGSGRLRVPILGSMAPNQLLKRHTAGTL